LRARGQLVTGSDIVALRLPGKRIPRSA
jgi:hypothetical protein